MRQQDTPRDTGRQPQAGAGKDTRKVPNTDMQADDAGTPDSGVDSAASEVDSAPQKGGKGSPGGQ